MHPPNKNARTVGVLLLLQMVFGLMLPFILWRPLMGGYPSFLTAAAASSMQIRIGVFLSFIASALLISLSVYFWSIIRQYSPGLATGSLIVCGISCAIDAIQNAAVMSMLSVSRDYVANGVHADAAGYLVAIVRRWVHYTQLFGFGAWIFIFYFALFRYSLVPRVLSVLGLICILAQFTGVTLMGFLNLPNLIVLAMPLAPIHAINGIWLIAKGTRRN
ncbi:MAG TPA: DUF4386 domain-containing protein [Pyrinomonadaceae bacterium]